MPPKLLRLKHFDQIKKEKAAQRKRNHIATMTGQLPHQQAELQRQVDKKRKRSNVGVDGSGGSKVSPFPDNDQVDQGITKRRKLNPSANDDSKLPVMTVATLIPSEHKVFVECDPIQIVLKLLQPVFPRLKRVAFQHGFRVGYATFTHLSDVQPAIAMGRRRLSPQSKIDAQILAIPADVLQELKESPEIASLGGAPHAYLKINARDAIAECIKKQLGGRFGVIDVGPTVLTTGFDVIVNSAQKALQMFDVGKHTLQGIPLRFTLP